MEAKKLNNYKGTSLSKSLKDEKFIIKYRIHPIRKEDTPGNRRKEIIPFNKNVPAFDVVTDDKGDVYPIGLIRRIKSDGSAVLAPINFGLHNQGYIMIDPKTKNTREIALYEYMEATDYNGSKKNRDVSKEIFFTREDSRNNAVKSVSFKKEIHEAQGYVLNCDDKLISAVAELVATPEMIGKDPSIQRDLLMTYAGENPLIVNRIFKEHSIEKEQMLKNAATLGIIENIKAQGAIKHNGEIIFKYPKSPGVKVYTLLAEHLEEENPDLMDVISKQIKVKQEEAAEKEINKSSSI